LGMADNDYELAMAGENREFQRARLATAQWADPIGFSDRHIFRDGDFWLGRSPVTGEAIGYDDNRHAFLCSGSRSGKGTSIIINNLCTWQGSVVVLDPKGENASVTAARRGQGSDYCEGIDQEVHVLDPFEEASVDDEYRSCFNPLDGIDMDSPRFNDEAMRIVSALIVTPDRGKDRFFDLTAQDMLRGVILHVKSWPAYEGSRNLGKVRDLLTRGERQEAAAFHQANPEQKRPCPFELLWQGMAMNEAGHGIVAGIGERILSAKRDAPETYQGIYQTCLTETIFLDSPAIRHVTHTSNFDLSDIKASSQGISLFLCLSLDDMENYFKWLRVMITLVISAMIKTKGRPATGHNVLMCLDEFPVLKRMKIIEDSVAQLAGYGLKMFFVVQNLGQLKSIYKDNWETFLGNSGVKMFFALNDHYFTMKYVSDVIGETEVSRETKNWSDAETHTETESESSHESTAEGESYATAVGRSSSRTSGQSHSHAVGQSSSNTVGRSVSKAKGTSRTHGSNYGRSDSSNWGHNRGENSNENHNRGSSSGSQRNSNWSSNGGLGTGTSQMFQNSEGRGWGRGTSKGENWGGSRSKNAGWNSSHSQNRTRTVTKNASQTRGSSITDTHGHSSSRTSGESHTKTETSSTTRTQGTSHQTGESHGETHTEGTNQALFHRPLASPNELNTWFAPIADDASAHYPGYCLVLLSGEHPTAVRKANYFEDVHFRSWFDPHPDFSESMLPLLSEKVSLQWPSYPSVTERFKFPKIDYSHVKIDWHLREGAFVFIGDHIATVGPFRYRPNEHTTIAEKENATEFIDVDTAKGERFHHVLSPAEGRLEYSRRPDQESFGSIKGVTIYANEAQYWQVSNQNFTAVAKYYNIVREGSGHLCNYYLKNTNNRVWEIDLLCTHDQHVTKDQQLGKVEFKNIEYFHNSKLFNEIDLSLPIAANVEGRIKLPDNTQDQLLAIEYNQTLQGTQKDVVYDISDYDRYEHKRIEDFDRLKNRGCLFTQNQYLSENGYFEFSTLCLNTYGRLNHNQPEFMPFKLLGKDHWFGSYYYEKGEERWRFDLAVPEDGFVVFHDGDFSGWDSLPAELKMHYEKCSSMTEQTPLFMFFPKDLDTKENLAFDYLWHEMIFKPLLYPKGSYLGDKASQGYQAARLRKLKSKLPFQKEKRLNRRHFREIKGNVCEWKDDFAFQFDQAIEP